MTSSDRALSDMHCHVGFMSDPAVFVKDAQNVHSRILAVSATPQDYGALKEKLFRDSREAFGSSIAQVGLMQSVFLALGLHPWWISSDKTLLEKQLQEFDTFFLETPYIGEIGLDFSSRRAQTKEWQVRAFDHILKRCADRGQLLLSIHCVQAYPELFACFEKSGVLQNCAGIFHWFSGSSEHLTKAIRQGCYFSINKRMLSSKRGREYAKAIPENRLLLETDAPFVLIRNNEIPSVSYTFKQVQDELHEVLSQLAVLRKIEVGVLAGVINKNAQYLLNLKDFMH